MPKDLFPTRKGPFKRPEDKKEAYYIKEFEPESWQDTRIFKDPDRFLNLKIKRKLNQYMGIKI